MKQRLLIISSHFSTGGAPQFTLNKIQILKDTYDIWCIEYDFLSSDFVVQRNAVIELLGDNFIPLYENKEKLTLFLDEISPDLILIEEISETFIKEDILKKIYSSDRTWKIIETTHSSHNNSGLKRYLPDKFTFVSEWSLEMYKHLGVNSTVIEYPIDKKSRNKYKSQVELGLDPNKIHVLNVGLFTSGKNQGYTFEIAKHFLDKNYEFHFVGNLAGNFQDYWSPLIENKPDNCRIWGERSDVKNFIEACDVFLFTSRFELNPLVIKETLCYDIPILMFNLQTYCGIYNNEQNCHFLNGDVNKDSKLLENIIKENSKHKFGYVLYSNDKYFEISKLCAISIRKWSNHPIYIYLMNSDKELDIENCYTINWKCNLESDTEMYKIIGDNFYINRGNTNIYKMLIERPNIVKDVLEKYVETVAYIDSDSIATKYVDNIFSMYNINLEYPYFAEGVYDYLFYNGRGGAETKEDLTNTLEHPVCDLYGIDQKIRERYRQTGYFVSGKNTLDFLQEWSEMCQNPKILENSEWFAPYNEETILNCLLYKKRILDGLPCIYVNGTLDTIDKVYSEIGFSGEEKMVDSWFRIPSKKENLLFFHGEKNPEILNKMVKKLEEI
jgi:glycosyltransferase involved in cell wall biosynthesis